MSCKLCGKPLAYAGALFCGGACSARWEGGARPDDEEALTGFFLRTERDGEWKNIDVGRMSNAELHAHFDKVDDVARLRHWVIGLASWIRLHCVNGPENDS